MEKANARSGPEMVAAYAALSDADKSVLLVALRQPVGSKLMTTANSANDRLWQMFASIGWMVPKELGFEPPPGFEGIAYALTDLGFISVPHLINYAQNNARQRSGD